MKNFLFFLFFLTSVYSWSQNQIGNDIDGDINSMSGFAVSLSGDG